MASKISRRTAMTLLGGAAAMASMPMRRALAADPTLLHVSLLPIYSVAPHFAADKFGYFKEQNIAVTTQAIQTGAVGIPGLMSGAFEVLYTNTVSVLTAIERGIDIRVLCEATRVPAKPPEGLALFTRKGETIKTGKDIGDRPIAINAKYTLQWLTLSRWIKATGGDPAKANFREIPASSMVDALKNKQVDVAFLLDPYKMIAMEDPALQFIAWPSTTVIPGLSTGVWVVSGKFADEKHELAAGYLKAYMKGGEWVNKHLGDPDYLKLVAEFTKMDQAKLAQMPTVPQEMQISTAAINGIGDVMQEFDLLKTKVDITPHIFK